MEVNGDIQKFGEKMKKNEGKKNGGKKNENRNGGKRNEKENGVKKEKKNSGKRKEKDGKRKENGRKRKRDGGKREYDSSKINEKSAKITAGREDVDEKRRLKNLRRKNRKRARKHSNPSARKSPKSNPPLQQTKQEVISLKQHNKGWKWWKSIGSPKFILAPMVGLSELPFRVLCRRYGASLAYTPMFIAQPFVEDPKYRARVWSTHSTDRPLVVQFCGRDPQTLLKAARIVENDCDAIDLNLGCPQAVAKRGGYGAFLMDDWTRLEDIVHTLSSNLNIPVLCKVRVFADVAKTVRYCKMLERAGASMLAVHPRQRHQREEVMADWSQVRTVKAYVSVPVVCNGDSYHTEDVLMCLEQTQADGVMCAQGLLYNPSLFYPLLSQRNGKKTEIEEENKIKTPKFLLPHMRKRRVTSPFTTFSLSFAPAQASINQQSEYDGRSGRVRYTKIIKDANRKILSLSKSKIKQTHNINTMVVLSQKEEGNVSAGDSLRSSAVSTPSDVISRFQLAHEYLDICDEFLPFHPSQPQRHIFFILFDQFHANVDLFDALAEAQSLVSLRSIVSRLRRRADLGRPHPSVNRNRSKKRPRYRDGSLAPPPWPTGGGGFHVSGGEWVGGGDGRVWMRRKLLIEDSKIPVHRDLQTNPWSLK
ncbi:hypothetical protein AAMO2058_000874700 [Amorphochlora amoebiformis]